MNVERNGDWAARARVHAALAEPARLRIVDHLGLGDASPSELQALVGLPSNLLAHHLQVLERAGVVTRRRSESDRRRSYLRLVPAALGGLLPGSVTAVPRVVFVCTANSARSQLAAALWTRASPVPVASAGTHPADRVAPGAVAAARRHGLRLAAGGPRRLDEIHRPGDLLVTVCDHAHEVLAHDAHAAPDAALHWSVPDPVAVGTRRAFDAAYAELETRITHLTPRLTAS
jgi:protein-tyrosine-phosphatase